MNAVKKYNTMVIVGTQWGDEGKGKITDYFAQEADLVVRFAGGDNAGHIIWNNGVKHKVTIVPSGILNPKVKNIIGNGTVINLEKLNAEIKILNDSNINTSNLWISDRAHVIFEYNKILDNLQEDARKERRIGTTGRGIGPTYSDKTSRNGIRISDFFEPNFKELFRETFDYHNQIITKIYNHKPLDFETIYNDAIRNFTPFKKKIIDCGYEIDKEIKNGKKVLFEGAQGVLLDIDHGTYPFVTSSNTSANNVSLGVGVHNKLINKVVGITKAYNTRVGAGAMPTEILGEQADRIRKNGNEYGSNTGRPRRIGWLDIVALKYAIRTGGIDRLFITLLDVLDSEEVIKICTAYMLDGKKIYSIPASNTEFTKCTPIFEEVQGWSEDISKVKTFEELPKNAKIFLNKIAELCEIDILGFSVGSDRKQTIINEKGFY